APPFGRGRAPGHLEPAGPGGAGVRQPRGGSGGGTVITAAFVLLALAALGFGYRLLAGPTLTDRVLGVDGLLIVGMSAITLQAMRTGEGAFVPVAVVAALVGFVGTGVVGRFLAGGGPAHARR